MASPVRRASRTRACGAARRGKPAGTAPHRLLADRGLRPSCREAWGFGAAVPSAGLGRFGRVETRRRPSACGWRRRTDAGQGRRHCSGWKPCGQPARGRRAAPPSAAEPAATPVPPSDTLCDRSPSREMQLPRVPMPEPSFETPPLSASLTLPSASLRRLRGIAQPAALRRPVTLAARRSSATAGAAGCSSAITASIEPLLAAPVSGAAALSFTVPSPRSAASPPTSPPSTSRPAATSCSAASHA